MRRLFTALAATALSASLLLSAAAASGTVLRQSDLSLAADLVRPITPALDAA